MGLSNSTGLISGINFNEAVSQLVQLEQRPILLLQQKKTQLESVSSELSTLSIKLSGLKSAAANLSTLSNFDTNTAAVTTTDTGVEVLTATAGQTAVPGSHSIQVNQLAQASSIASQGFVDQDTTAVAGAAGTFKFRVGTSGAITQVNVTSTTTLGQLKDAINSSGGGVVASIINDGSGSKPFRLLLTAKESGASNTVTVTENPTSLDFTNKKIEEAFARVTNSYAGTVSSNSGNNYTGTTNKSFLVQIVAGGSPGSATYKYSTDGGITFKGAGGAVYDGTNAITTQTSLSNYIDGQGASNGTNEGVQVSFGAGTGTLAVGDEFSIDVFNPTMTAAKDAVVQIDNILLSKSTNTITDAIQGVTLDLLKAEVGKTVNLTVTTDFTQVKESVDAFVSAYNDTLSYLDDQLSFDPDIGVAKPLLGDTTALLLKRQLQNLVTSRVPGASSGLNSLAALGLISNPDTAELSVDDAKFQAALSANQDDVTRLFVGIGVPTHSAIEFIGKTEDTQPGTYGIQISQPPTKALVKGLQAVPSGGITLDEVISVSLFSNATATGNTPTTVQITATAGSTVNDIANALNSAFATKKMEVSASNNNGFLEITSTNFGDDFKLQVLSNLANAPTQSGIGTTALVSQGVDVAGTINGFKANGKGAVLTSASGFSDDGLSIRAAVASAGSFGTITISSGIADRMANLLENTVNTLDGTIKVRQDGLASSISDIDDDIARKSDSVDRFEQRTLEKFQRLEVLLSKLQTQSQALNSSLASLQNLSTVISRR